MAQVGEVSNFASRIGKLLERVEYRRVETADDKREIFRMRHDAYVREGAIPAHPSGMFTDRFDDSPNAWLIRVSIDGELAGSIRLHLAASVDHDFPAMIAYSDVLTPYLRAETRLLYASRHVNKPEFSRRFPEMPLITMRPGFLAEQYFNVDYLIGTSRAENQGAFRRLLAVRPWCEPRIDPGLAGKWALMAYDCHAQREKTLQRYPFYQSTAEEQRNLLCRSSNSEEWTLTSSTRAKEHTVQELRL